MIEEVAGFLYTEATGIAWSQIYPYCTEAIAHRVRALAALEAITPMIEKLIAERASEACAALGIGIYREGFDAGQKAEREEIAQALEREADEPLQDEVGHYAYRHAARIALGVDE